MLRNLVNKVDAQQQQTLIRKNLGTPMTRKEKLQNKFYFHRRPIGTTIAFCSVYTGISYNALSWENEYLRMGVAGSIAQVICETSFHCLDTVQIKAKAAQGQVATSTFALAREIYRQDGIRGFFKGWKCTFYCAAICGFVYFSTYKLLKSIFKDYFGKDVDPAFAYAIASMATSAINFFVGYPYDMLKCRFQSANDIYKY